MANLKTSFREIVLHRIDEITQNLDQCVAEGRPDEFLLEYSVETRKRLSEPLHPSIYASATAEQPCHPELTNFCGDPICIHPQQLGIEFQVSQHLNNITNNNGTTITNNDNTNINSNTHKDVFVSIDRAVTIHSVHLPRLLKLFVIMQDNLNSGRRSTKRDVYYQDVDFWKNQGFVDKTLDIAAKIIKVPRNELGIVAASKGLVAGDLIFTDTCNIQHDATNGIIIPDSDIATMRSKAQYLLVIEKQATYTQLLSSGSLLNGASLDHCIAITGCGYPDYNTRKFVCQASGFLKIPVLLLVDCDPHGIHIALVYKFGSCNMRAEEDRLSVPTAKWIGILPTDIQRKLIPEEMLLAMRDSDWHKLDSLKSHPSLKEPWLFELRLLEHIERKAEIQSIAKISPDFLVNHYLPLKIRHEGWLN